jgi:hypothetical protein
MSRLQRWLALCLVVGCPVVGCQTGDSSVQPEKLATPASGAVPATATGSAPAPASAEPGPPPPLAQAPEDGAPADSASAAVPSPDGAASPDAVPSATTGPKKAEAAKKPKKPSAAKPAQVKTTVELVKAGAEPRKELRFAPKVGLVDKMTMTMTLAVGVDVGGRSIPKNALPPMVVDMNLKVTEVRPDGDVRYEFAIHGTDVRAPATAPAQLIDPMKDALARMRGLGGHTVMSNRGQTKEAKINFPQKLDPQTQQILQGMEQAMNQIVVALPEEPVGLGAQWRVTNAVDQNGVALSQILTYDLVEIDGETARCDVTVTQKAPPQKVPGPGGAMLDLTSLKSSGSGKVAFRLDHVAPTSSRLALASALEMTAKGGAMKMETDVTVEMRSP